jgi:hypothetical protein
MRSECLPLATPYDPAEDPPGSVDPLGTVTTAEQLAEVLFTGMTARMWRSRHLTFTALAALVADHAAAEAGGNEDLRLEARLALERLFVSAIARQEARDDAWRRASRRLPGISLARRGLVSGDQPLGRQTFLKGQAINGPFGVVSRFARHTDIIDEDSRLGRSGQELLLAWAAEQKLPGLLNETTSTSAGMQWLRRLVGDTVKHARDGAWPSAGWWGWEELADRLRPDQTGQRERAVLFQLLTGDRHGVRRRVLELLESKGVMAEYRRFSAHAGRGEIDRHILLDTLRPLTKGNQEEIDRLITYATGLIDAYEQVAGSLESVMRGLLWGLTHHGGRAKVDALLADVRVVKHLAQAGAKLAREVDAFQASYKQLAAYPQVKDTVDVDRLGQLLDDALVAREGQTNLIEQVMQRHVRVQRQKGKGFWIERDAQNWTLISGFGDSEEVPWMHDGAYLHPYRVLNAYSFLTDLDRIAGVEVPDGDEE